jgi:hypothetical protein
MTLTIAYPESRWPERIYRNLTRKQVNSLISSVSKFQDTAEVTVRIKVEDDSLGEVR